MKEKREKGWNFSFYKSPLSLLSYPTTPQDLSFTWLFINYVKPTTWSLHKLARLALAILQASVIVCTHEHFAKSLNKLWTLWVKTTSRTGLTVYAHKNCLHTINPEKKGWIMNCLWILSSSMIILLHPLSRWIWQNFLRLRKLLRFWTRRDYSLDM